MTVRSANDVYYDMYDVAINADPYPVYRRLREEAPLYYNDVHDFFAVSRFADVERGLLEPQTFISGRGAILEVIRSGVEMPPGVLIFEDPPTHSIHRRLVSRAFTARRVAELEGKIRDLTARCLDPLAGSSGFDLIGDLGAHVPMQTIGMLLGIPEADQAAVREHVDATLRTKEGEPMRVSGRIVNGEMFGEYIDWRAAHPSDDLMTELLQVEFEDETGTVRRMTRDELLTFVNVIAGAGNETTNRLIGWAGKTLADHPEQRRELVGDRSLLGNTIEELLRYEPPGPHVARYVAEDVEFHGRTVPEGSVLVFLLASANRDDRRYPDGDRFDIHRDVGHTLTFGYGIHFCMGAALARLEGRIVLDELLDRFPEWDVDLEKARLSPTSTVRGWETLPIVLP
ncbi:MAG TPA: cytochrome P450 [Acidimicrobiales bacterium]|nr:cytochrome P450 [Acidimicrobiales bacterium]